MGENARRRVVRLGRRRWLSEKVPTVSLRVAWPRPPRAWGGEGTSSSQGLQGSQAVNFTKCTQNARRVPDAYWSHSYRKWKVQGSIL